MVCLAGLALPGSSLAASGSAELVFANGGSIVSMRADGSGRRHLTGPRPFRLFDQSGDSSPEISPDGSRLLFLREVEQPDDVYVQDLMVAARDGSGAASILRRRSGIPSGDTMIVSPTWSSDGNSIYLTDLTYRGDEMSSRVVRIAPNGGSRQVLLSRELNFGKLGPLDHEKEKAAARKLWSYTDVDASPDGTRLLLGSSNFIDTVTSQLRIYDLAESRLRTVPGNGLTGTWSPEGTRIAFVSMRDRLNEDCYETCTFDPKLYVMNADGTGARRVIGGKARAREYGPTWSPDGTRIAFSSDRNFPSGQDSEEIYSVKPDGTCLTWLTNGTPGSAMPQWAPEKGSADPGACGAAGRPVRSTYRPPRTSPAGQPVYWLGPNFGGMLPTYYSEAGSYLDYGDCGYFSAARCNRRPRVTISGENVCRGGLHWSLEFGRFDRMTERRGALVAETTTGNGWPDDLLVNTGNQTLAIAIEKTRFAKESFAAQMAVFRALRRAGTDRPLRRFPQAKLSRRTVRAAARIARIKERTGSVGRGGRNLGHRRALLRFHRSLDRIGEVRTVPCPGPRSRPELPGPLAPARG